MVLVLGNREQLMPIVQQLEPQEFLQTGQLYLMQIQFIRLAVQQQTILVMLRVSTLFLHQLSELVKRNLD